MGNNHPQCLLLAYSLLRKTKSIHENLNIITDTNNPVFF